MKPGFLSIIKWDLVMIYRYGIVAVAAVLTGIYAISFLLNDMTGLENVLAVLIFSDPVMYGFLFTAVIILFEKDAQTHQALAVTPMSAGTYLLSKAIAFTLVAALCSLIMVLTAQPAYFNVVYFFLAVVLSSVLFVFVGVIGVSFVQSFNQFILVIPLVMAPVCLPFLDYFGLVESFWFYLIPTQACLLLFKGMITKIETWQAAYALIYLISLNGFVYLWAKKRLDEKLFKKC